MSIPRKFWRGKMRQSTFFTPDKIFRDGLAFEKNRKFSWKISFSDRFFRLTLVKCLLSYAVLKSFVRKVRKPAVNPVVAVVFSKSYIIDFCGSRVELGSWGFKIVTFKYLHIFSHINTRCILW